MKETLKTFVRSLPAPLQKTTLWGYSLYQRFRSVLTMRREGITTLNAVFSKENKDRNILFFNTNGLSAGGTEKTLQILAKHLDKKAYNVFYMYAPTKPDGTLQDGRKKYLENSDISFIEFSYTSKDSAYPFFIHGMHPHILDVIKSRKIDLVVTAGSGYSEYPLNVINKTPIININIFGSPNTQRNIAKNVSISHEVDQKIASMIPEKRREVMYIPSEKPTTEQKNRGLALRASLNIPNNAMAFGRIGRADNGIFDPIGIRSFSKIVAEYPFAHYIIMSPPPILEEIVKAKGIPNVHFLPASANEDDIWAFHNSIDVLAHFRYDGESCGLNIIESMLCGKPIISHKSPIWNAHLEYLEPSFSIVTGIDDTRGYVGAMKTMIEAKQNGELEAMSIAAQKKAEMFFIDNNIKQFEDWIVEVLG